MNRYQISYTDFDADRNEFPHGRTVVVAEAQEARNGIDAIYATLRARGVSRADLDTARSVGSNKRLILAGITFTAKKL
jgi:hypothetical protein